MFDKILVANRGEIAVRVMVACEELDEEYGHLVTFKAEGGAG